MAATLTPNPDYGSTSTDISRESNCNQTAGAPRQFGYARVSTYDQDLSLQIEAKEAALLAQRKPELRRQTVELLGGTSKKENKAWQKELEAI